MGFGLFKQKSPFCNYSDIYKRRNDDKAAPPRHMKIRVIIINCHKVLRVLKIRSKNVFDLEKPMHNNGRKNGQKCV